MKIIGLDVGEKRIGVAKADSGTRIAVPVGVVDVDGLEYKEIAQVARMNNTNIFVIGLPRSNEGNETKQSLYVRNFAKALVEQIPDAKIRFQDESLTSVVAEERLNRVRRNMKRVILTPKPLQLFCKIFWKAFPLVQLLQEPPLRTRCPLVAKGPQERFLENCKK